MKYPIMPFSRSNERIAYVYFADEVIESEYCNAVYIRVGHHWSTVYFYSILVKYLKDITFEDLLSFNLDLDVLEFLNIDYDTVGKYKAPVL